MALTDENGGGIPATMLVGPTGYGNNGGMGGLFGGDLSIIVLFFLFMMLGGWGNGFGGGFGGGIDTLYPWMNNSQNINNGFRDQMLGTQISGIQNSITSGFGDMATALCGGFAGVNASINGAQSAITQQMYQNTIADMERSFGVQSALQNCCCENRASVADLKYAVGTESCATRTANAENTNALLAAFNGGIQSIKDQLCQDKIDAKNDVIAQLRSELLYARGQASQDVQTAAIQAGQRSLANEVEQYVAPRAVPAYVVQNPNCCGTYGMSCAG